EKENVSRHVSVDGSGLRSESVSTCAGSQGSGVHYVQSAGFRSALCAEFRSGLCTECRVQECVMYRVQGSGVRYVQSSGVRYVQSAGFRSALCTECRVQGCTMHTVQGPGVCYVHSSGFRSALCTECRIQECVMYRVPNSGGSGVRYVQSAVFRSALCTECRVQECVMYRVQGSGVRYVQSAWVRSVLCTECRVQECVMYRVQSSGVHYVQSVGFRDALCTQYRVQGCVMYRVQGSGVHYVQSAGTFIGVCSRQVEKVPIVYNETFIQPVYQPYLTTCRGHRTCSTYRTVYSVAVRQVKKEVVQVKSVCCPGWKKKEPNSESCEEAVCRKPCQNGGTCIKPNMCRCPAAWGGRYCHVDIDECRRPSQYCPQICVNTRGGYRCECHAGYVLQEDGKSCIRDKTPPSVPAQQAEGKQRLCFIKVVVDPSIYPVK
ncbi:hypothetical protein AB205_0010530, partial [Aquarana catesbeiana]